MPTPGGSRTALTWTPDGQALVFVGRRGGVQQLYVRRLDAFESRPPSGTDGAELLAVSPDGQWVAFWANGAIRKVALVGGPVMDLAAGIPGSPVGLVWGDLGDLFFAQAGRIWQLSAEGTARALTTPTETETGHSLPWPLPGGHAVLYTVRDSNPSRQPSPPLPEGAIGRGATRRWSSSVWPLAIARRS